MRIGGDDGRARPAGTAPRPAVPVGELIYEVSGVRETAVFTYHRSWLQHPNRFPLSPDLPLQDGPTFRTRSGNASALPLPISDGTPDSWGQQIIKMAFKGDGRGRVPNDLDFLLEADDFLRSGALRYFDGPGDAATALAAPRTAEGGGAVPVPRLYELHEVISASRAFEADPEGYQAERGKFVCGDLIANVGSLGGARPKVNARDDKGQLWIAKLAKQDDAYALARTEVMALRLAARVGIQSSKAEILPTAAQRFPVALVKRFDRLDSGARVPFISAQTFMGLEGTDPGNYVDVAHRMMTFCANPKEQMAELHRRLMFTVLIQNTDDHLRNLGFIAAPGGKWRLSPAYDINPVPETGTTLKTAISDLHGNALSVEAVIEVAPYFDLTEDEAASSAREMAETIRQEWRGIGASLGMSSSDYRAIAPAMESPQVEVALRQGHSWNRPTLTRESAHHVGEQQASLIERVGEKRLELDSLKKKIKPGALDNLDHAQRIDITYTSNALEGNTLTAGETTLVIEKGITVGGKPLKDHLEAVDHARALEWVIDIASGNPGRLTEADIRNLHYLVVAQSKPGIAGRYADGPRYVNNSVGLHAFPPHVEVPALMQGFVRWLDNESDTPQKAFDAHRQFVAIHPFNDGNGRTARLLMNLILIRGGYPPISIRPENRPAYVAALETSQTRGEHMDFERLMLARLNQTLDQYIAAAKEAAAVPAPRRVPTSSFSP